MWLDSDRDNSLQTQTESYCGQADWVLFWIRAGVATSKHEPSVFSIPLLELNRPPFLPCPFSSYNFNPGLAPAPTSSPKNRLLVSMKRGHVHTVKSNKSKGRTAGLDYSVLLPGGQHWKIFIDIQSSKVQHSV